MGPPTRAAKMLLVIMTFLGLIQRGRGIAPASDMYSFQMGPRSGTEDGGPIEIVVTRTGMHVDANSTVAVASSDGTATAGADYLVVMETLEFQLTRNQVSVTVTIIDDGAAEDTECFTLTLSNPDPTGTLGSATEICIVDNEDPCTCPGGCPAVPCSNGGTCMDAGHGMNNCTCPSGWKGATCDEEAATYNFEQASYSTNEGDGPIDITIIRTGASALESTLVDVVTSDGTAVAGMDYIPQTTTLNFIDTNITVFTVTIIDDDSAQDTHCFTLSLMNPDPSDGQVGADTEICIIDDEDPCACTGNCPLVPCSNGGMCMDAGRGMYNCTCAFGWKGSTCADEATVYNFEQASYSTNEGDGPIDITIIRTGASALESTLVDVVTSDGTAVAGMDYSSQTATLNFTDTNITVFTVTIIDDDSAQDTHCFTLSLMNPDPSDGQVGADTEICIIDDEDPCACSGNCPLVPCSNGGMCMDAGRGMYNCTCAFGWKGATCADEATVYNFEQASYSTNEGDGPIDITIIRTGASALESTLVDVVTSDGTAVAGMDYIPQTTTLNFIDTNITVFTVTIIDDDSAQDTHCFTLSLMNPDPSDGQVGADTEICIIDDEDPCACTGNCPLVPCSNGGMCMDAGRGMYNCTCAFGWKGSTCADEATVYNFEQASYSTNEGDGPIDITIIRTGASALESTLVDVVTSDGTAVAGMDYSSQTATLNFTDTNITVFTVTIIDDDSAQDTHCFTLSLMNPDPSDGQVGADTEICIIDDEDPCACSGNCPLVPCSNGGMCMDAGRGMYNCTCAFGWKGATCADEATVYNFEQASYSTNEGDGPIDITIIRTGASALESTLVDVVTSDGTAVAGMDYSSQTATLNFTDTNITVFTVTIIDDDSAQDTHCFTLSLMNPDPSDGQVGADTEICIIDDEDPCACTGNCPLVPCSNGGMCMDAGRGMYNCTCVFGWKGSTCADEATVYNFEQASYSTNEGDGPIDITIIRTGASALESTLVDVVTSDGTAVAGMDYSSQTATLNFTDTNITVFTVTIIDDDSAQDTHCFTLSLMNPDPSDGQVGADTEICIIDDEDPCACTGNCPLVPCSNGGMCMDAGRGMYNCTCAFGWKGSTCADEATVYNFEQASYSTNEGDGPIDITIIRTGASALESTLVDVVTTDGTAVAGTDYLSQTATLNFTDTNITVITVTIIDDDNAQDMHCFTLSLMNPDPSDGQVGADTEICIIDDEDPCACAGNCPLVPCSNGGMCMDAGRGMYNCTCAFGWKGATCADEATVYNFEQASYSTNEGDGPIDITIIRTGASALESTLVDVVTSDGTAVAGMDYLSQTATLNFTDTNITVFTVTIIDDDYAQDTHCFTLSLMNPDPSDGQVGADTEICIIDDEDVVKPVFDPCPPVLQASYPTDLNFPTAVVSWTPPNVTDNSGGPVTVDASHMPGEAFNIGVTRIMMNATDESGNMESCVFNVTVVDDQQPNVTCPTGFTLYTDPQSNVSTGGWSLPNDAFDNSGVFTATSSLDPTEPLGVSNHHVSYTVVDAAGNDINCGFYITVLDNEDPFFEPCPTSVTVQTDPQQNTANVSWPPVIPMDNVAVQEYNSNYQPGHLFPIGDTDVEYNVTDTSGNTGSCFFVVTVEDMEPPAITCPSAAIVTDTDPQRSVANVTYVTTAADNSGEWTVSCTPASATNFQVGVQNVMCIATDPSDNTETCSFAVLVSDNEDPVFDTCPSDITLNEPLESFVNFTIMVNWTRPGVTDNVGVVRLDETHEPGSVFGIGSHLVTYTAYDAADNMATCQFNVIVNDVQPPVITGCPVNLPRFPTDPTRDTARAFWDEPQASDNSGSVTRTSNYDVGDAFPVGDTVVVYTAEDGSGNTVNCSFVVQVYDNEPPAFTGCPFQGVTSDTGLQSDRGVASWSEPQGTDNVAVANVQSDYRPGDSFPLGATVVTYTVTDTAGLVAECAFTITISDGENPSLTNCPASFTLTVELATDTAVADWIPPTALDNSGTVTLSTTFEPGQSLLPGEYSVTYTATDPAGRTATCPVFTITVEPNHNECSLPEVMGECSSRGLTCVNQLEGYTCDCPTGFFKAGNSDTCLQGRMFRFTFVIVEISNSPAVFTNDLTDPTSVAFLSHQRRLENLFSIAFGNLSEFGRIIVLYFFSGSIGVEALISVNGNSTANQTDVENSIDAAISADDLFLNSEYKVTPSATTFLEEVCLDGFCDNGGTCQPNASSYLSSCVCPAGFSGDRCETVNDTSLSSAAIVAIIASILGLLFIVIPTGMLVFLTMTKRARLAWWNRQQSATTRPSERRKAMYESPHPRIYLNKGFRPSLSEFTIPYMARSGEADIPLRQMMSRDESIYY
ncbi:uncharacterized protein LOC119743234 isoform X2 [Patiria miniata]|uniref:Hyalin n=1 Tax=Patiria miniata TaxID=46514 RepID=A0A914BJE2_PATMI|nr:uncharacterized protein LOC119743234 isoform X2 [Patiria miniata]